MNIKMKKLSVLGAVLAGGLFVGQAQAANSVNAGASVEIAAPISVTQDTALAFGNIGPSAASGTVAISLAGAQSVTGGVTALGGTVAAGAFSVTGANGASYSVSVPASVTLSGPGTAMTATLNHDGGGSLTAGTDTFNVGGTLSVGANQTAGSYSGTYTVSVDYQ
ncbi:MAG: hypothetical protein COW30_18940 [Rhodospirillales bacterium CG15_BIG_FIL_POST_REV_8_21_14_020_66_15]|nr:MAG: hypothetical protein COW30_18940 [Rhodospirillales bacterium CG15_BIG_FIL_POST_REV_8_21_14_020_66_15]